MTSRDSASASLKAHIAVIDAQPLYRVGIVQTLRSLRAIDTVAEGECIADALRIAGAARVDLMLLDLRVPGGGAEALKSLVRMWPAMRVVVLTSSEESEDVRTALQCGVRGYMLKSISSTELIEALKLVARGEVYLTPSLGARLLTRSNGDEEFTGVTDLTTREDQILSQVSIGATNKEIARALSISEKTVKYYMTNIMQKLQVRNRVEAVVVARKRGGYA